MSCKRILLLAGGCVLAASGAWADDLGYVDCSSHSDDTPVFTKARKSPDQVGAVACGERFTILLNGFIFSRIETKDGKIGYIYSNYISLDRGATGASVRQPDTGKMVEATSKVVIPSDKPAQSKPAPAQVRPAAAQQAPVQASVAVATPTASDAAPAAPAPNAPVTNSTAAEPSATAPAQSQPAAVQPAQAEIVISAPSTATPSASAATDVPAASSAPASASPATAAPASSPVADPPAPTAPETPAKPEDAQPAPAPQPQPAAAQPQPAAPAPAAPPVRDARVRESWEKPNPSVRAPFAIELFGGFTYTRYVNSGAASSNFVGGTGSFAWNFKPWLQIVGDSTYSYANISGSKNALYGNHYGPRFYFRKLHRWNVTPFVEGLVGGTRADTTVTGAGGYTTSANCISYKVGGGVDMHTSRHWELRLFDVDYYRTAFGSNLTQSNYTVSTGIVLQLFASGRE